MNLSKRTSKPRNSLNDSFDRGHESSSMSNFSILENVDYTTKINEYNLNLQTIKSKRLKKKRFNPIEPDGNFKSSWDIIGLLLIIYEAIVIPYRVSFNIPS